MCFMSDAPSWSHKTRCLEAMRDMQAVCAGALQKMMNGQPLDDDEQLIYDEAESVDEKIAWLVAERKRMVAAGTLTAAERDELLGAVRDNLAKVAAVEAGLDPSKQAKKAAKVAAKKEALGKRERKPLGEPARVHEYQRRIVALD